MEEEGFITLDETGICENGSMNDSSKRKADESGFYCDDSIHPRKKLRETPCNTENGVDSDSDIVKVVFRGYISSQLRPDHIACHCHQHAYQSCLQ